jgi:transcriptional regulator with XRE-family HTH domain
MIAALREACNARGLDQRSVEESSGLAPGLLDSVEDGQRDLRYRDVVALCRTLEVRVSELAARAEELLRKGETS